MKKLAIFLSCIIGCSALLLLNFQLPQNTDPEKPGFSETPFEMPATEGWYKMKAGQTLSTDQLLKQHKSQLGFSAYDDLQLVRRQTDELGFTHHRYDQYHRGIKVDAGQIFIHEKDGAVTSLNGKWVHHLNQVASPKLSPNQAVQKALQYLPARRYLWESEGAQRMLQKIKNDPQATFYPKAELVWFDPSFSNKAENYRLAYSMEIQAESPLMREEVYIDALNGELLHRLNTLEFANSQGTAITRYNGEKTIITDSMGVNSYRLIELDRSPGVNIYTLDLNSTYRYNDAVDFEDDDNFWFNINAEFDEVATDAHWAAEMTHDYLMTVRNYRGVDGAGLDFGCYVHFRDEDEDDVSTANAFWNGNFASFGDGDDENSPLTTLDIVAHEFGHGIDQFSSNLRYRGESGAIDESLSDIWGATIEFWATPGQADWGMGEDCDLTNSGGLRNMADPNDKNDPDTYDGRFWGDPDCENPGMQDNCFVHTNSGVQNYWYYLLVEGGSGINDNDDYYDITGLGLQTASDIVWRGQQEYLFRDAKYVDAMGSFLQAAEDLYGLCSTEYITVANTWRAVGVGDGIFENDVRLSAIMDYDSLNCGLLEEEFLTIQIDNRSCFPELTAGTKIPVAAQVDGGPIVRDTLTLTSTLTGLESIEFTFTKAVSGLHTGGVHTLAAWTEYPSDTLAFNDTTTLVLENVIEQNSDFTTVAAPPLESDCFLGTQTVSMEVMFLGCDKILAGAELDMYYRANNGAPVMETTTLSTDLNRGDMLAYTFSTPLDLSSQFGTNEVDFWVDLADDFLNDNDTLFAQIARNPYTLQREEVITFEAGDASLDSVHFQTTEHSSVIQTSFFRFEEPNILQMSGGDFVALYAADEVRIPNQGTVWSTFNQELSAQACFCVDASGMQNVNLNFDRQQEFTRNWQALYGQENPFGSAMRVLVDGVQVGDAYYPETLNSDQVSNHDVNLDDYADMIFELCFESRCGFSPEADAFNRGDLVRIDNVKIEGIMVGTNDLPELTGIRLFPNPSTGLVNISYSGATQDWFQIEVFDISGKKVRTFASQFLAPRQNQELNLEALLPGTYFLHIRNQEARTVEKIVLF